MNTRIPSSLNILTWNANCISTKKIELTHFLTTHRIDVALIQETHLKPSNKLYIPNYKCYRRDRNTRGGGTAILIKQNIQHNVLPDPNTIQLEANGIEITTKHGKINIYSVYHPPQNILQISDIELMLSNTATILAGDFNAKHPNWNSTVNNYNGNILNTYLNTNNLAVLAPSEPTRYHTNGVGDVLDIALIKNLPLNYNINVVDELSSYHQPIIINIGNTNDKDEYTTKHTNWYDFRSIMKTNQIITINEKEEINDAVLLLEQQIKMALNLSTKTKTSTHSSKTLPDNIINLIKYKNKMRRNYHRTLAPIDKGLMNEATRLVKTTLEEYRNKQFAVKLEQLSTKDQSLWKMAKTLRKTVQYCTNKT